MFFCILSVYHKTHVRALRILPKNWEKLVNDATSKSISCYILVKVTYRAGPRRFLMNFAPVFREFAIAIICQKSPLNTKKLWYQSTIKILSKLNLNIWRFMVFFGEFHFHFGEFAITIIHQNNSWKIIPLYHLTIF